MVQKARIMPPKCCPCSPNSPVLKNLHWLPVEQRVKYKVLLLTYESLHGKAPAYISQWLSLYTPTRPLRTETRNPRRVPRCHLERFGRRCFAYAAPSLLNLLNGLTFKSSLKTYQFDVAYPSLHLLLYCMSIFLWLFLNVFYLQALLSTMASDHFWIRTMFISVTLLYL